MTKAELLVELSHNTFVMLQPSPIEGVGVFAITVIAKGCRNMFSKPNVTDSWITVSKTEVETLPLHAQFLVGNYCLYDEANYFVPGGGFKKIDLSLF